MPWMPGNAINVWRWEIHWLYDTVSVFPMKMCMVMYPFEGPNGHLHQGQKMKWGEQWSRPWKWSWCARYISSKRSFRSRQSLTKDCKHVGSTFECHCHWWIGSMFKTFSELLAENGNWALCVLTAGMSASCVFAYKNFQPQQLPSPLKSGYSANSTSSPLHQVCRRDLYFVWKSPKMASCAYSHKMPSGTFGLVHTILNYFDLFYTILPFDFSIWFACWRAILESFYGWHGWHLQAETYDAHCGFEIWGSTLPRGAKGRGFAAGNVDDFPWLARLPTPQQFK